MPTNAAVDEHRARHDDEEHHVQPCHVARRADRDDDEQEDRDREVTRSTTPTHVYPASNRAITGGMLSTPARMNARMKTRRPLRRISDSSGDAPIDMMPSRTRFQIGWCGIPGTYPQAGGSGWFLDSNVRRSASASAFREGGLSGPAAPQVRFVRCPTTTFA